MFPNGNLGTKIIARRELLRGGLVLAGLPLVSRAMSPAPGRHDIRIGTTAVFLDDQLHLLRQWSRYLEERLGQVTSFVHRHSYQEITDLLLNYQIDAAWVCSPPYLMNVPRVRLLCVPVWEGEPLYRSYVIVPTTDTRTRDILDLRGRVYAFSDPQSNSGHLVPMVELLHAGFTPVDFFEKFFFTYSHRDVVGAVSIGLADGGSVDGYVWETMKKELPGSTDKTRVAWRSPLYGFPPLIARSNLQQDRFDALQRAFVEMHEDPVGRVLLTKLNLDGFAREQPALFASVRANLDLVGGSL